MSDADGLKGLAVRLDERLLAAATRQPDAPLLWAGDQCLSGQDWITLVDSTTQRFQQHHLGAGAFIGWLDHNSPPMLAALAACARLGAVLVPLNWRLAVPELAAIATHAGLSALFNGPALADLADAVRQHISLTGPAAPAQPGDVLLVYTSGTTGQPKAAMHSQQALLANITMAVAVQGLTPADRVLAVLPLFHVGGLCIQVLPALAVGAAIQLQPRFDAAAWLQAVATWRPSTSVLVPAAMQALLQHPAWGPTDLASLRFVNSGSQVVPLALIAAFHARGVPVAQVYGSTETGPVSVALPPGEALAHPGSVGRPAPGVRLRLVDAACAEVKPGQVGEIHLQAPNLMRGYHRLPAGTGCVDGWFATGDLAWADAAGYLHVAGRSRDLIISGGENIHPAEIENLAICWPGVDQAAVVGLPDARWGEVPALALVAQPGVVVDVPGLRAHLASQLARFKQPRRIALFAALPRTALGKVQKPLLLRMLVQGPQAEA